jgi:general secretion pathway protein J
MIRTATRNRGFTLVEVMVSVAILTMVAAMVYSTIAVTLTAQDTAKKIHEYYHAGWVAMSKMSKDLTNAFLSKHVSVLERNRETLFLGRDDEVTFTYLGHFRWYSEEPESDQGVVSYFVKSKQLIRREKTIIDDQPDKGGTEDVLAVGVKDLEFEYWDPEQEDWVDDWKAEFDDTEPVFLDKTEEKAHELAKKMTGMDQLDDFKLPPRVRIKLVLEDEEGREYPFETETELPLQQPFNW